MLSIADAAKNAAAAAALPAAGEAAGVTQVTAAGRCASRCFAYGRTVLPAGEDKVNSEHFP